MCPARHSLASKIVLQVLGSVAVGRYVFERSCSVGKLGAAAVKDLEACIVLSVERSDRARTARFHNILRVVEP